MWSFRASGDTHSCFSSSEWFYVVSSLCASKSYCQGGHTGMLLVNLHTDSCQELPLTNKVRGQYCKLRTKFFSRRSYASINSSCANPPPPPGQPRGICSRCQSRGWGIRNFIAARGLGISIPQGDPRAFDTRVFERWMAVKPLSRTDLSVRD